MSVLTDDFLKQKIVWKRIGSSLRFSYDDKGLFGLDSTCIMTGKDVEVICAVLNSYMGQYLLKESPKTGTGDLIVSVQALEPILLPKTIDKSLCTLFKKQIEKYSDHTQNEINNIIYRAYNLSVAEIEYIELYTRIFQ